MPLLQTNYFPPPYLRNGHTQTLWAALFRRSSILACQQVRLTTPDNDFIDLDIMRAEPEEGEAAKLYVKPPSKSWPAASSNSPPAKNNVCKRAVVLSHGLEGNTKRPYMLGMAHALLQNGWDVVARHFRGCSGELARQPNNYHMGETNDLHTVVQYCVSLGYSTLALIGFSMGGSQTLKYLAETPKRLPPQVKGGVGISVPCDLVGSAQRLSSPACALYMAYFMRTMLPKVRMQAAKHADFPSIKNLSQVRTFNEFDERFTAPLNGFASALDYWTRAGCGQFLPGLQVPTLLLNAADDPFMTPSCHPIELARQSDLLTLELCPHGGHVGFVLPGQPSYYSELRALSWLREQFG